MKMTTLILQNQIHLLSCGGVIIRGCRGAKSLPISWVKPEKIPCFKPQKSGDLKPLIQIDSKEYPLEFRDSEELKSADETVKRLFSLEYFPYKKTREVIREAYIKKIRRHDLDINSPEARVAKKTANIRILQQVMEKFPGNVRAKVHLKETIDNRKKLLKLMRLQDYKCFEWVLEKMDLIYKPFPPMTVYKKIEQRRSMRMLTEKYCEDVVEQRLNDYRQSLEKQQENFLIEKIELLKWMRKEEVECGLEPSINKLDVEKAEAQLETLRKSKLENSQLKQS